MQKNNGKGKGGDKIIYWEDDIDEVSSDNKITDGTLKRVKLLCALILLAFLTVVIRLVEVSSTSLVDKSHSVQLPVRGSIYDRNGKVLAINLPTKSIYIKPEEISDFDAALSALADALGEPKKEFKQKISQKITDESRFIWIKRHILPSQNAKIKLLGMPGIYSIDDSRRFYPHANELSHTVGFVDVDQRGIAGIEKSFDDKLSRGEDVKLSIDARVQSITHEKLQKAIDMHDAIGGMAVVMDARNGEVVSIVSMPDFNPNKISKSDTNAMFNRATLGVYEMGSTFKILTLAMGLDSGSVRPSDYFNVAKPIKLGRHTIGDYRFHKANLSLSEVLVFSSNRGIAQVGAKVGIPRQQSYMKNIGMLSPVNLEISEVAKPLYVSQKNWNDVYLATMSYGHGIAVTALHTVQSVAAVANGGMLYKPTLLKQEAQPEGTRVFKESTSKIMRAIMRLVVKEGYAKKADVMGYDIGGKTGTAEKVKNGKYMKKDCNLVLFTGAFPIEQPQYVIMVAVDEPKPNNINKGFTTGGMIAAPLASEIIHDAGHLLGVHQNANRYILQASY